MKYIFRKLITGISPHNGWAWFSYKHPLWWSKSIRWKVMRLIVKEAA